jgi:hypothetical protein
MGVLLFDHWLPDNHCLEELVWSEPGPRPCGLRGNYG